MSQSCGSRFRASRGPGRGRGVSQARAVGDRGPSFETPPSPSHCPCSGQDGVLGLTSLAWECRPPHQGARPPVTALQPRAPAGVGGEGDWPARPLGCGARWGGGSLRWSLTTCPEGLPVMGLLAGPRGEQPHGPGPPPTWLSGVSCGSPLAVADRTPGMQGRGSARLTVPWYMCPRAARPWGVTLPPAQPREVRTRDGRVQAEKPSRRL